MIRLCPKKYCEAVAAMVRVGPEVAPSEAAAYDRLAERFAAERVRA